MRCGRLRVVQFTSTGREIGFAEIARMALSSKCRRVHVQVDASNGSEGKDLAVYLSNALPSVTVAMGMSPGVRLGNSLLVYETVLSIRSGDLYLPSELEHRAGSVSVHYWPGAPTLDIITDRCDAPYGYFLVLPREDIGTAKVWMANQPDSMWQIIHAYPLDESEPAEFAHHLGKS